MSESGLERSGERLRVAFHCAPARPPEDWWGGLGGEGSARRSFEAERLGLFQSFVFLLFFFRVVFWFVFWSFWDAKWGVFRAKHISKCDL